ncbi:ATP-binding protein [Streptomyces sp. NPDC054838]
MGRLRHVRYSKPYAGIADSVPVARRDLEMAAQRAGLNEELTESALLCLSEVAANAVRHAIKDRPRPRFIVTVKLVGQRRRYLRLEVHDPDQAAVPTFPPKDLAPEMLLDMDTDSPSGRGLAIVAALSDRAGVVAERGAHGKSVWCEFRLDDGAAEAAPDVNPPESAA